MKAPVLSLFKNPLLLSSSVILVGSMAVNVLNYVFNLVMGRMLNPVEYGELVALIALVIIISVPATTLSTVIVKTVAHYKATGEDQKVAGVLRRATKFALLAGSLLFLIFAALTPLLSSSLNISLTALLVFALLIPASLLGTIGKGGLQGLQNFKFLSTASVLEALLKLTLSVLLILMGFSVAGAMLALVLGSFITFALSYAVIRRSVDFKGSVEKHTMGLLSLLRNLPPYTTHIFVATLLLALFANIDVVMAKRYLGEVEAGNYAALTVVGKILSYGSLAIITVLFPMVASARAVKDGSESRLLGTSLLWTTVISLAILALFYTVPELIIRILLGSQYVPMSAYLGLFGLAMFFVVLSKVFVSYFMAMHEKWFVYPFALFSILQIVLLGYFHASIGEIVYVLLATSIGLLMSLVLVYFISRRRENPPISASPIVSAELPTI